MNDTQTALIQLLRENGKMPRNPLSEMLGISLMGVSKSLASMARSRLITVSTVPNGGPGRPSEIVEIDEEGGYSLGVHIAHLEVTVALVNLRNSVVFFRKTPFSFRTCAPSPRPSDLAPVLSAIRKALASVPAKKLMTVGFSFSGDFDLSTGHIMKAHDFVTPGQAEAFRRVLAEETGLPVVVVHDTEAGLIAERWCNPGLPVRPTLLYISDALGLALMFEGRLFRGAASWRRWLGHSPVPGSRENVPNYLPGPLAATAFFASWTDQLQGFKYGHRPPVPPDVERAELTRFYELFEENDPRCRKIVQRGMRDLAVVVRNLCFTIPLDGIIMSGWVPEILDIAIAEVRRSLREASEAHGHELVEMKPTVYAAILGERTQAAGAALFAMDDLFSHKMTTRGWKKETGGTRRRGVRKARAVAAAK